MDIQKNRIRNIVGGIYDIQKLRIATGNRIVASLRPGLVEDVKEGEEDTKYLPAILRVWFSYYLYQTTPYDLSKVR